MRRNTEVAVQAPPASEPDTEPSCDGAMPAAQLEGIEEFGSLRNWLSFDAPRGRLVCKSLETEYAEFQGVIVESRVVRVMKDEDGSVLCASTDRAIADTGRVGRECADCEDRDEHCFPRWCISWRDSESGLTFAHTLSTTASFNFTRYANALQKEARQPDEVMTRIYVEEAKRQKTGTIYRRLQFEPLAT